METSRMQKVALLSAAIAVAGLAVGQNRAVSYTYYPDSSVHKGLVHTIDGPRTDVQDITTYTYHTATRSDGTEYSTAQVHTVTNAVGHTITLSDYSGSGHPQTITDENGVKTTISYDWKGNILTASRNGKLTEYRYDGVGQLTDIYTPDGVRLHNDYDDAQRLTHMCYADFAVKTGDVDCVLQNQGYVGYEYDHMNNIESQTITDVGGTIVFQQTTAFDELSRLRGVTDGQGNTTSFDPNKVGQTTNATDAKRRIPEVYDYDALGRLESITNRNMDKANFTYTANNQIKTVTDYNQNTTTFHYNAFGDLTKIESPDTGTATFDAYDDAGNLLQETDARGRITCYEYDALNRITKQGPPQDPTAEAPCTTIGSESYGFIYDNSDIDADTGVKNYGVGKLEVAHNQWGAVVYEYNADGQVRSYTNWVRGQQYERQYDYDSSGRLEYLSSPNYKLRYSYDNYSRLNGIYKVAADGSETTLFDSAVYKAFGPMTDFRFGNDQQYGATFYRSGRIATLSNGPQYSRFTYDPNGNIVRDGDGGPQGGSWQSYGYDRLDRLDYATGDFGTISYGYDANSNRTSRDWQKTDHSDSNNSVSKQDTLVIAPTSNQVESVTQVDMGVSHTRTFGYTANGHIETDVRADGTYTYHYNHYDRLEKIEKDGRPLYEFGYNYLGQRTFKYEPTTGKTTFYWYDLAGQRIAETRSTGSVIREYFYLGSQVIAMTAKEQASSIVDNADTGFSSTGNWVEGDYLTTYTPYCRYHCPVYERARYGDVAYSEPKQVTNSGAIVVEDMSSLATYIGNWSQHTTSDQPPARGATGASYKSASNTAGTQVRYNLPMTGEYGIYVSMPTRYGLDTQARVRVAENGTTLDAGKVFNSAAYGDEWIYIGDYNLTNGNAFLVLDSANPGTYKTLASDAILLLPKGQQPQYATATFTHATTQEGLHTVELVFANDHVGGSNVPVTVEYTNQAGQQVSRQFTANLHSSNSEQFTTLSTLPDVRANTNISVTLSSKTNGYVYADAIRVKSGGEAGPSSLYFVHNDHIATPEAITDAAGNLVWQRHTTPFGDHMPQAVTGFLGEQQGFPGQHFDDTTGLSYNYFRDYDPTTGRYIQSDPIGLNGGLNTYGYVGGNPVGFVDPTGEIGIFGAVYGGIAGGVGGAISGGWKGAIAGAGSGALIGWINPFASHWAGAAAGAALGSYAGQAAGNFVAGKRVANLDNYNHCAAAGAAIGGGIGGLAGRFVGRYIPTVRRPIIGRPIDAPGILRPWGNTVGATIEGAVVGVGEYTGAQF